MCIRDSYEVGFGAISIFKYDFEQAIEYASGYNTTTVIAPATYDTDGNLLTEEVTESVYTSAAYYNTGSYSTQGFRFSNTWGPVSLMLKVNDTEQVRIPEYVAVISWEQNYKGVDYKVKYSGQFDRVPGQYDFLPEGQEFLDDLKKLNIYVGKQFASGINLNFTIDNVTDQEVEVLPYYNSQGREYRLALNYKW